MADVKITKAPSLKVTSLGNPTKSGNTFKEDWKIPADAKSGKKNNRFTHVYYQWKKWVWNGKKNSKSVGTIVKKATVKLGASGDTSSSWWMDINDFYPKKAGKYLTTVSFSVVGKNGIGSGPSESGSYKLQVPPDPTITKSVNAQNGTVSFTIKSTSTDAKPRTDTLIWIGYKRDIKARPGIAAVKDSDYIWITDTDQEKINGKSYTAAEVTKSVDLNYATGLGPDDWVKVICKAKARGVRGDSATKGPGSNDNGYTESAACHIWAQPGKPTIGAITVTGQIVTVKLTTGHQAHFHVVDKVQLQRAHVDTGMAPDNTTSWTDVSDAVDDETCVGLNDNVNDALPSESGKTVWYRVKSTHDGYTMYSDPKISSIVTSTESADQSKINSLSIDTNVTSGTVNVFCGFSKAFKNGSPTSNSIVYSYAELVEPQTYASLDFSNETILTDTDLGIIDNDNGEHNISWFIPNLTTRSKYILRVCRAKCSNIETDPSVDSRGKWAYYTIADESNGVSAKLLDASPFTVPSSDDILQNYLNSDSNIVFDSVTSQFSGKITAKMIWYRGSYSVLGVNNQKGSDKSVLEYIKQGENSWSEGAVVLDSADPDQEGLDSTGTHTHIFTISNLEDGAKYRIRFKRVLTQGTGSSPVPSQDLESEYVYFTNVFNNYVTVFDPDETVLGNDTCKIEGVVVDSKKESMTVNVTFTNEYGTNGTQLMWSTKYAPKTLTTGTASTYDVSDSDLASSAIVEHNGSFDLIIDDLKKGDLVYLDARRFVKDGSNTSYGVNYASGNRYSDQECALTVYVSADDDRAYIESLSPSSDGTTVTIITSNDENDDSDGTEISYSKRSDAWNTTSGPETYDLRDSEHNIIQLESNSGDRIPINPREISITDLDPGTRYYFKVRRYMDVDGGTSYGEYSEMMEVVTPYTVNQDVVYIDSIESEKDGQGLRLTLGWYDDSSTETEISYSDYKDAWISSSGADIFEVVDSDWLLEEVDSSESYKYKATAIIRDLEEGVKYYIRARRKSDDSHGSYTDTFEAIPLSMPDDVVLNVPNPVSIGENFSISWSHQAYGNQTAYILNCSVEATDSQSVVHSTTIDLSSGEDSIGFVKISWDDFYSKLDNLLFKDNSVTIDDVTALSFTISITTGGDWISSTVVSSFATPPLCFIDVDSTIIDGINFVVSQPAMFSIFSDISTTIAFIRLESQGVMQLRPEREVYQPQGDCIWTSVIDDLAWTDIQQGEDHPEGTSVVSRVTPPILDLIDNGSYILYVSLYNNTNGLISEEVSFPFTINWDHQASAPSGLSRINKIGTGLSIAITPVAPDDYEEGDVCDIYRRTQNGAQLIYEGAEFGMTIVDDYPPYSMHINTIFDNLGDGIDLWYTLMTRTIDGDIEFLDFPYSLTKNGLTLDWDGGAKHLELPWNLTVSNSYSKDFENRVHMDGTVTGYWNQGSTNTGSFNTVMCKIDCLDVDGATRLELCRQLATYTGPVFVRTPYGEAFCADVTLEISQENNSQTASISLSYTEIDFVDEFSGVYNGEIDDSTT